MFHCFRGSFQQLVGHGRAATNKNPQMRQIKITSEQWLTAALNNTGGAIVIVIFVS